MSRGLGSDFILKIIHEFWLKLQNAKCSGIFLDLPLDSDRIELHQFVGYRARRRVSLIVRGTRSRCAFIYKEESR